MEIRVVPRNRMRGTCMSHVRTTKYRCRVFLLCAPVFCAMVAGCETEPVYTDLRVYSNPYAGVDWINDMRLKSQHHDHIGRSLFRIRAYDNAGYHVLSLMDYSGNHRFQYALRERMWPADRWVPGSFQTELRNIQLFVPNAEEVGYHLHATSPFLTAFIEGVMPGGGQGDGLRTYDGLIELFRLVRLHGGTPCLAHPWNFDAYYRLRGPFCTEIYTAFGEAQREFGDPPFVARDKSRVLVENWDKALAADQRIFGIAVNDHFGPYVSDTYVSARVRDSGKIIVLSKRATLEDYREAFDNGAFFAVRDFGLVKDEFPDVWSIEVDERSISIYTNGEVTWISHGVQIAFGPVLTFSEFFANARYVRAEITNGDPGTVVYTQPFVIRPVGDVDGDYVVDGNDESLCLAANFGVESNPITVSACAARAGAN
jgi:hypothetical protein